MSNRKYKKVSLNPDKVSVLSAQVLPHGYQAGFLAAITLNRKVDDTCELCGASPMTAKCNNAGCEDK